VCDTLQELNGRVRGRIKVDPGRGKALLGQEREVLRLKARDPDTFERLRTHILKSKLFEGLELYGFDVPPWLQFFIKTGYFPFCRLLWDGQGLKLTDSSWALCYALPALRVLKISLEPEGLDPTQTKRPFALCFQPSGEEGLVLEHPNKEDIERTIERFDPDVILAPFGDGYTLRRLLALGVRTLSLSGGSVRFGQCQTIASYGRVYAKKGPILLEGRLHLDPKNSFFYPEVGLEGLIELSRLCVVPLQELSRTTPGRAITLLEVRLASLLGYLVPFQKGIPEGFKTLEAFLKIDKGGLSFRPLTGLYENVAEYDFASMYPSIIVNFNLSYETLECGHPSCRTRLPITGYGVCSKDLGIVPLSLKRLIKRREAIKAMAGMEGEAKVRQTLEHRQKALKWLLVVSFGYLGYRNAKFGRIEAHEATTAIGRELLLFSKEIAEEKGFRLLHALTDALWVHKEGATMQDYLKLEQEITQRTNASFKPVIPKGVAWKVKLEGVYAWVRFLPSKVYGVGVANRYVGAFQDGTLKARGILLRRSDTPAFIRNFQEEALAMLACAPGIEGLGRQALNLRALFEDYLASLEDGRVPSGALAVRLRLSRPPLAYRKRSFLAEAAQSLLVEGLCVSLGETIRFVRVQDKKARACPLWLYEENPRPLDTEYYRGLLQEALEELLPRGFLERFS
jgi:DNA polymerase-2